MTRLVRLKVVLSNLNKDLIRLKSASGVNDTDQNTRVWQNNPHLLLETESLLQLHAVHDRAQNWLILDIKSK